jgi:predicted PurR-regulated permease PerM
VSTQTQPRISDAFVRKVMIVIGLLTAATLLVILIWQTLDIFMLLFAGILLAVFLTGISGWIRERTPLSHLWALALVTLLLLAGLGLFSVLAAPSLIEQGGQLGSSLQIAVDSLQAALFQEDRIEPLGDWLTDSQELGVTFGSLINQVSGFFSRTFGLFVNVIVILFIGFYLAFEPDVYANGFIKLFPTGYRPRVGEVLDEIAYVLRWWLIGRLGTMVIVGAMSMVGLFLLDIPLAFFMGILAGMLAFIPVIGVILAFIPPLLIAFTISPTQAFYVFLLYLAIEVIEGYLVTPIIQRKAVALPPVLLIFLQVIFGLFFNLIGLLIAAPAAAVLMVLTKMLYVGDVLGDYDTELLKGEPVARFSASRPPKSRQEVSGT